MKKGLYLRNQRRNQCDHLYCSARPTLFEGQWPFEINGRNLGCSSKASNDVTDILDLHYKDSLKDVITSCLVNLICDNQVELEEALLNFASKDNYFFHAPLPEANLIIHEKVFYYSSNDEVSPFDKNLNPSPFTFLKKEIPSQQYFFTPQVIGSKKSEHFEWSLIVPVHRNTELFKSTLKFISGLTEPNFELIVTVDKIESEQIKSLLLATSLNWKIVILEDKVERKIGGAGYRAGIARNWGAAYSSGEKLVFMDADMLVRDDSLSILKEELKENQFLQGVRNHLPLNLVEKVDQEFLKKNWWESSSNPSGDGFWENFYTQGSSWGDLEHPWKYISSYFLVVHKSDFLGVNGFAPSFTEYGFEDVELGYKLIKRGLNPKLSSLHVAHQDHRPTRSEYAGDEEKRQSILKRMAHQFYKLYLNKEVADSVEYYLRSHK